jgi:hypothetical protein
VLGSKRPGMYVGVDVSDIITPGTVEWAECCLQC